MTSALHNFLCQYTQRNPINGCMEWLLSLDSHGYGQKSVNGHNRLAHRYAWELGHGFIPEGLCVCHKCDNPPCCNPDHLFLGTKKDNAADRNLKGRQACRVGERNPLAKLQPEAVREMRARYRPHFRYPHKDSARALAVEFDVSRCTISKIVGGRSWKHLKVHTWA